MIGDLQKLSESTPQEEVSQSSRVSKGLGALWGQEKLHALVFCFYGISAAMGRPDEGPLEVAVEPGLWGSTIASWRPSWLAAWSGRRSSVGLRSAGLNAPSR